MPGKRTLQAFMLGSVALFTILLTQAHATSQQRLSERCDIGDTCSIPGNDGGVTYYSVKPSLGVKYKCDIESESGKLRFWVTSDEQYQIISGNGYYVANPSVSLEVTGRFKDPNDQNTEGQLKFIKLLGNSGKVTCYGAGD